MWTAASPTGLARSGQKHPKISEDALEEKSLRFLGEDSWVKSPSLHALPPDHHHTAPRAWIKAGPADSPCDWVPEGHKQEKARAQDESCPPHGAPDMSLLVRIRKCQAPASLLPSPAARCWGLTGATYTQDLNHTSMEHLLTFSRRLWEARPYQELSGCTWVCLWKLELKVGGGKETIWLQRNW